MLKRPPAACSPFERKSQFRCDEFPDLSREEGSVYLPEGAACRGNSGRP